MGRTGHALPRIDAGTATAAAVTPSAANGAVAAATAGTTNPSSGGTAAGVTPSSRRRTTGATVEPLRADHLRLSTLTLPSGPSAARLRAWRVPAGTIWAAPAPRQAQRPTQASRPVRQAGPVHAQREWRAWPAISGHGNGPLGMHLQALSAPDPRISCSARLNLLLFTCWNSAVQRLLALAACGRTHADWHQPVAGCRVRQRPQCRLYEVLRSEDSGVVARGAPPTAYLPPGLTVSTRTRHPQP